MNRTAIQIVVMAFFLLHPALFSLMKMSPEQAGKSDPTLRLLAGSYQTDEGSEQEVGTKEIKKPDGSEDKVYYSTTTPKEEVDRRQEEKDKVEKSLDMLRNMIIVPKQTR